MSGTRTRRLNLRLFLEGQEVPVISAIVAGGRSRPATASIQIIPIDPVYDLKPRTLVHLFYLNPATPAEVLTGISKTGNDTESARKAYNLLFVGELSALQVEVTSASRVAVLQCMDLSSYWDSAKQYYHTGGTSSAGAAAGAFSGSTTLGTGDEDKKINASSHLIEILTSQPSSSPNMVGLMGGIVHLLESIGGVYGGNKKYRFRGMNDFFSVSELRLKLSRTLGISPNDTSSQKLFKAKGFKRWLSQTVTRRGNLISFRELIGQILPHIYHQYNSVPAPSYRPPYDVAVRERSGGTPTVKKGPYSELASRRLRHLSHDYKQWKKVSGSKSLTETKGGGIEAEISALKAASASEDAKKSIPLKHALKFDIAYLVKVREFTQGIYDIPAPAFTDPAAQSDLPVDHKDALEGSGDNRFTTLSAMSRVALKAWKKAYGATTGGTTKTYTAKTLTQLNTHTFHPEIFFCAPPKCNVILPDMYESYSFQRNFLAEITRLQMQTQKVWNSRAGSDISGPRKKKYWAPDEVMDSSKKDKNKNTKYLMSSMSAKKGIQFVMPHEKFSGIIPKFDFMADIEAFKKINQTAPQEDGKRLSYLQRSTNFNFWLYRFLPRRVDLAMTFSPQLVPGLPAVIITRPQTTSKSRATVGAQILGVVDAVSHSVSQTAAKTRANLSCCRLHNETPSFTHRIRVPAGKAKTTYGVIAESEDDQLEVDAAPFQTIDKSGKTIMQSEPMISGQYGYVPESHLLHKTDNQPQEGLIAKDAPPLKGVKIMHNEPGIKQPQEKKILNVAMLAKHPRQFYEPTMGRLQGILAFQVGTKNAKFPEDAELYGGWGSQPSDTKLEGGVLRGDSPDELGPKWKDSDLKNDDPNFTRRVVVVGKFVRRKYKDKLVEFDLERGIFPAWMSPIYANVNIGRFFYQPLLGCDSITDRTVFLDVGQLTSGVESNSTLDPGISAEAAMKMTEEEIKKKVSVTTEIRKESEADQKEILARSVEIGDSVESAVEKIAGAYDRLKRDQGDVSNLIETFTFRRIATMWDVLGDSRFDLSRADDPNYLLGQVEGKYHEGFHSVAYGNVDELKGLDVQSLPKALRKGKSRSVDPKVDPRKERWEVVIQYLQVLRENRGGVPG